MAAVAKAPATKIQVMRGVAELRNLIKGLSGKLEEMAAANTGDPGGVSDWSPVVYTNAGSEVAGGPWVLFGLSLSTWLTMSLFMTTVLFVVTWWYDKVIINETRKEL